MRNLMFNLCLIHKRKNILVKNQEVFIKILFLNFKSYLLPNKAINHKMCLQTHNISLNLFLQ